VVVNVEKIDGFPAQNENESVSELPNLEQQSYRGSLIAIQGLVIQASGVCFCSLLKDRAARIGCQPLVVGERVHVQHLDDLVQEVNPLQGTCNIPLRLQKVFCEQDHQKRELPAAEKNLPRGRMRCDVPISQDFWSQIAKWTPPSRSRGQT
jgi:hypothetical protein